MASNGRFEPQHGLATSRMYKAWEAMKQRCYNPKCNNYPRYGEKGIAVCDRWRKSFVSFYDDMGPPPSEKHTLDRIDSRGNYEPENCRWATMKEQQRNRSSNKSITCDGETLLLCEWSEKTGLSKHIITKRLKRGWSPEKAICTPSLRPREVCH